MAQAEEYDREQIDQILDSVTPDQIAAEIIQISEKANTLKVQYAELRKAKNSAEIDRLLKRTPMVDLPNMVGQLAERTAGAFLALVRMIERAGLDDYEDDEDDEDGAGGFVPDEEAIAEAREKIVMLKSVLDFVDSQEGVPDAVVSAALQMREEAEETEQMLANMGKSAEEPEPEPEEQPVDEPVKTEETTPVEEEKTDAATE